MDFKAIAKTQLIFFVKLTLVTLLLFAIHSYLIHFFFNFVELILPLWLIYVFNFILVFIIFSIINFRYKTGKTDVFNVFMLGTLLKMVLILVFFLPIILSDQENKTLDTLNFFIPYFIFLAFEVYSISKFLVKK